MGKKIISTIIIALMIVGLTSPKVLAEMDKGTVVIGNKAFDLAYANDPAHSKEIINAIVAGGKVYVKDFQGNWIENISGVMVPPRTIPAVTYKNVKGAETKFDSGDCDAVVIDKSIKIIAAKAISNTRVQVDLQEATSHNLINDFKITEKSSGKALEIKDFVIESNKVIVLETEAMVAGKAYKLIADREINFTGIAVEKTAPKPVSVKCSDTNEVKIEFDKALDYISAINIDNYKIESAVTVVKSSLDNLRKVITLRTEGISKNKMYKINIKNIMGIDGAKITNFARDFVGKEDKLPPTAGTVVSIATTNNRIKLSFNDEHGVEKKSAENKENYLIKTGTTELDIISIKALDENNDGYYDAVEVLTETQNPGKKYEVSLSNLMDDSILRNVIKKPLVFSFYGKATDRQAPEVDRASVKSLNDTIVTLTFNESNALDLDTVLDTSNYEFNGDLEATSIKLINDKDLYSSDAKTALITTTEQTKGRSYTLTVKNIADEYGNYIKPIINNNYPKYYFNALGADTIAPYVISIVSVNSTTVNIIFNEDIVKLSAQDPTNYTIASSISDLGTAVKAELQADRRTVKLTTLLQEANERYTITITGIADILGNTAEGATAKFMAKKITADTEKPTIIYASLVNKDEIWVYFSEAVIYNSSLSTNVLKASANGIDNTNFVKLSYVDSIEGGTILVFKPSVTLPSAVKEGTTVYLNDFTANLIRDYSGNVVDYRGQSSNIYNRVQFIYYNVAPNDAPEVVDCQQVNAKTIRVTFNERIKVVGNVPTILGTAHVSSDNTFIDFVSSSNYNNTFKVNFHGVVTDMTGMKAKDIYTEVYPWISDADKPEILNVYAVDNSTVRIETSEELGSKWIAPQVGSYRLYRIDGYGRKVYLVGLSKTCGEEAYQHVNFIVTSELLRGDTTYYLEVIGGARDIAGNYMELRGLEPYILQGSDKVDNKVEDGIAIINSSTFRLVDETISSATLRVRDSNAPSGWINVGTLKGVPQAGSSNALEFKSPIALVEASSYEVSYKNSVGKLCSYEFSGIAINPVVRVLIDSNKLAKIDYSGVNTQIQTIKAYKLIKEFNGSDSKFMSVSILGADTEKQYTNGLNLGDIVYVVIEDKIGANVIYAGSAEVYSTSEKYNIPGKELPDTISPKASVKSATLIVGEVITTARSSEIGAIYLVNTATKPKSLSELEVLVSTGFAKKVTVTKADQSTKIATKDLVPGIYVVYAVDMAENMSLPSEGQIKLQKNRYNK
ncbi:Ig-like domain-containing protein [Clostridium sp. CS001]|uniref:Ig-like domain-containing protein n=1 Tax=Clostridium sp. CS001 TaxID=2880648 RepID=UPI001CF1DEC2|nr:Ig-like domain-containing protein [Clostridium sp. CS001]MCB2289509.1 Ig-like domain-containing protein [Clostridium sp. CS001]